MERCVIVSALTIFAFAASQVVASEALEFRDEFRQRLVKSVPDILAKQDSATGQFGEGIWIVNDQHAIYPLAAAWALEYEGNPYYHDQRVLDAIVAGGDALIEDADESGRWVFRKKDGSTWGDTFMPWTYSRWVRAYWLVREGMTPEQRQRWEKALELGYTGISAYALNRVHNIPAHHAMGLYIAGMVLDRKEWKQQAADFMAEVVAEQDPVGFWTEHSGPVVAYNNVYIDALGTYYALSKDETVLPALERAANFHSNFTYPDGSPVETIDERNPYSPRPALGNVGFCFSAEGRGWLKQQIALGEPVNRRHGPDDVASFLLFGQEGDTTPTAATDVDRTFVTSDRNALIRRKGAWFVCLSAYHTPQSTSRWIQDRQNLVSIFNDACGLIVGGGNTKMQPLWSTFTVGDTSLLKHTPGDESPEFVPKGELWHVPSAAGLGAGDDPGLGLRCGSVRCSMTVEIVDDRTAVAHLHAEDSPAHAVEAHLTLVPRLAQPLLTARGENHDLKTATLALNSVETGGAISHAGWTIQIPAGARLDWPVLPHNPYRKDGAATVQEGLMVLSVPFAAGERHQAVTITIDSQ